MFFHKTERKSNAKIICGNADFSSLKDKMINPARYMRSTNLNEVVSSI